MASLAEELPAEMKRVRDKVMPAYIEIGPPGAIGLAMMRADLDRAAKALASGNVIAMIQAYEALKAIEL